MFRNISLGDGSVIMSPLPPFVAATAIYDPAYDPKVVPEAGQVIYVEYAIPRAGESDVVTVTNRLRQRFAPLANATQIFEGSGHGAFSPSRFTTEWRFAAEVGLLSFGFRRIALPASHFSIDVVDHPSVERVDLVQQQLYPANTRMGSMTDAYEALRYQDSLHRPSFLKNEGKPGEYKATIRKGGFDYVLLSLDPVTELLKQSKWTEALRECAMSAGNHLADPDLATGDVQATLNALFRRRVGVGVNEAIRATSGPLVGTATKEANRRGSRVNDA